MAFRSIFLFSRRQVSPVSDIGEEGKGERVYCLPISQTTYNGISLWFQKMSPISASPPSEVPAVWPDCARPPRSSVRPHRCGTPDTRSYLQCCALTSTRTEQPSSYNIRQRVMASGYNRDDLLIAEFKEAFNEFDKVGVKMFQSFALY